MAKPTRSAQKSGADRPARVKPSPPAQVSNVQPAVTQEKVVPLVAAKPPATSAATGSTAAKRGRKARPEVLFLVETAAGSQQFEMRQIPNTVEFIDLVEEDRKVIATRKWREF